MESQDISVEVKKKLSDLFNTLNPFQLRKAMEKRLKKIFRKSPKSRGIEFQPPISLSNKYRSTCSHGRDRETVTASVNWRTIKEEFRDVVDK
jgi:hypothetical protein